MPLTIGASGPGTTRFIFRSWASFRSRGKSFSSISPILQVFGVPVYVPPFLARRQSCWRASTGWVWEWEHVLLHLCLWGGLKLEDCFGHCGKVSARYKTELLCWDWQLFWRLRMCCGDECPQNLQRKNRIYCACRNKWHYSYTRLRYQS